MLREESGSAVRADEVFFRVAAMSAAAARRCARRHARMLLQHRPRPLHAYGNEIRHTMLLGVAPLSPTFARRWRRFSRKQATHETSCAEEMPRGWWRRKCAFMRWSMKARAR